MFFDRRDVRTVRIDPRLFMRFVLARPVDEFIAAMDDVDGPARTKRMKEWWAETQTRGAGWS